MTEAAINQCCLISINVLLDSLLYVNAMQGPNELIMPMAGGPRCIKYHDE